MDHDNAVLADIFGACARRAALLVSNLNGPLPSPQSAPLAQTASSPARGARRWSRRWSLRRLLARRGIEEDCKQQAKASDEEGVSAYAAAESKLHEMENCQYWAPTPDVCNFYCMDEGIPSRTCAEPHLPRTLSLASPLPAPLNLCQARS
jgi:hypothetical protein